MIIYKIWFPELKKWYNDHSRNASNTPTLIRRDKLDAVIERAKSLFKTEYCRKGPEENYIRPGVMSFEVVSYTLVEKDREEYSITEPVKIEMG